MKVWKVIGTILMWFLMVVLWIAGYFLCGFIVSDMILPVFGLYPTVLQGFYFVVGVVVLLQALSFTNTLNNKVFKD